MVVKAGRIFIIAGLLLGAPFGAAAQSIQITSPTGSVTVAEADDFASSVLQNPWDFTERRDIGWEENFSGTSINAAGGWWTAISDQQGPYVFPLFGGLKTGLFSEGPSYDRNNPRFGINHPIDTSRYTQLSFKMNQQNRSSIAVHWNNNPLPSHFPDGNQMGAAIDGYYQDGRFYSNQGWQIYSYNMSSLAGSFEQVRGAWTGNVIALRLDSSLAAPAGSLTQFDWMRLTDPSTGTIMGINWNSSGLSARRLITIYVDTDSGGYDGTPLVRFPTGSDPGSYAFNTAILPPGNYWFYVVASSGTGLSTEAQSGYSGRLTVAAAPAALVRAPSETSGLDYATVVRGNPWDMNDVSDIANMPGSSWPQQWRQFTGGMTVSGVFQALADVPLPGNLQSDAQVHLPLAANQPIDPRRFRYLTYKMGIDAANYPSIEDKVGDGWIARPIFWTGGLNYNGPSPKGHIVYEGVKNYSIDLWGSNGGTGVIDQGYSWISPFSIPNLRIDPLETRIPTWFFFDEVLLTEENRSSGGVYDVRLDLLDSDSGSVAVSVYRDTDPYGFDGVGLVTAGLAPGSNRSILINTAGWVAGRKYWLYLVLSDGANVRRQYIPHPIIAERYFPAQGRFRAHLDFDRDGRSDTTVYRPLAAWYLGNGTSGRFDLISMGGSTSRPVEGDFDGDLVSDYTVAFPFRSSLIWLTRSSLSGVINQRVWGVPGDVPAVADYNGDMKDDIAIWRSGPWYIVYDNGAAEMKPWGLGGDFPVAADYDGDNHADLAVWRPSTGTWWILNSGFQFGYAPDYFTAIQWGLPGDIPIPFDYDGDGRGELIIFRQSNGTWFIRSTVSSETTAIQWGLPGDVPTYGDFDGDRLNDLAVYRPGNGTWYIRCRSGQILVRQWGLPGDQVAFR